MRLPAVAIAAAFASGILLGRHPEVARNAASFLILSNPLRWRVQSLRASSRGTPRTIGEGRRAHFKDGSRRRRTRSEEWRADQDCSFLAGPSTASAGASMQAQAPDHQ